MSRYILIVSLLFFVATSLFFRRRGYTILVNHMNNIISDKMKYQTQFKKQKKNSNKFGEHKDITLAKFNNEKKLYY